MEVIARLETIRRRRRCLSSDEKILRSRVASGKRWQLGDADSSQMKMSTAIEARCCLHGAAILAGRSISARLGSQAAPQEECSLTRSRVALV